MGSLSKPNGLGVGSEFGPKRVGGWVGSMSRPKRVGVWVRHVLTQIGLGVGPASGPKAVGFVFGPKRAGIVHVRTQEGCSLGPWSYSRWLSLGTGTYKGPKKSGS